MSPLNTLLNGRCPTSSLLGKGHQKRQLCRKREESYPSLWLQKAWSNLQRNCHNKDHEFMKAAGCRGNVQKCWDNKMYFYIVLLQIDIRMSFSKGIGEKWPKIQHQCTAHASLSGYNINFPQPRPKAIPGECSQALFSLFHFIPSPPIHPPTHLLISYLIPPSSPHPILPHPLPSSPIQLILSYLLSPNPSQPFLYLPITICRA